MADGELVELRPRRKVENRPAAELTTDEKRRFYAELLWLAKEWGYSPGWSSHKFRDRTGVWPNYYDGTEPAEASPTTRSWVHSRQIAWAKRRRMA